MNNTPKCLRSNFGLLWAAQQPGVNAGRRVVSPDSRVTTALCGLRISSVECDNYISSPKSKPQPEPQASIRADTRMTLYGCRCWRLRCSQVRNEALP